MTYSERRAVINENFMFEALNMLVDASGNEAVMEKYCQMVEAWCKAVEKIEDE